MTRGGLIAFSKETLAMVTDLVRDRVNEAETAPETFSGVRNVISCEAML